MKTHYKKRTSEINSELDYYIAEKFETTIDVIGNIPLDIIEHIRQYIYVQDYLIWKEWHI